MHFLFLFVGRPYPIKIKPETQGEAFVYQIRWDKPNSGGLPIESYEFQYREVRKTCATTSYVFLTSCPDAKHLLGNQSDSVSAAILYRK